MKAQIVFAKKSGSIAAKSRQVGLLCWRQVSLQGSRCRGITRRASTRARVTSAAMAVIGPELPPRLIAARKRKREELEAQRSKTTPSVVATDDAATTESVKTTSQAAVHDSSSDDDDDDAVGPGRSTAAAPLSHAKQHQPAAREIATVGAATSTPTDKLQRDDWMMTPPRSPPPPRRPDTRQPRFRDRPS